LILTFVNKSNTDILHRGLVLLLGLIAIFLFTRSSFIYKIMKNIIKNILIRKTSFPVYDYQHILGLAKGFSISKIKVKGNSWLKDKKLKELKLNLEGAMILSLYRYINGEEKFIAIPNGDTEIKKGDTLICYSKANISKALSRRAKGRKGQNEHEKHKGNEKKMAQIRQKTGGYEM
ncbi:MAG TPA: TrkA C-terminal domain-containing protein, partial [Spirochaetota bacterium]|nr:TrkA C-terminal domain-containing protein [Spirochaetota bacterium]